MALHPQIALVKRCLLSVGYGADDLEVDLPLGDRGTRVPLVAFSGRPFDTRSACVAAIRGNCLNGDAVSKLRPLASPVVVVAGTTDYEVWRQGASGVPHKLDTLSPDHLPHYFQRNRDALAPGAIYRAKVWGRLEREGQLDFVDVGLLPLLEEEAGLRVTKLLVGAVNEAKDTLGWGEPTPEQGQWLLKSVFWLLAAKILQDKHVEGFIRLDLEDLDAVFLKVARHYSSSDPGPLRIGRNRRRALEIAAAPIKKFTSLNILSTEALGYVYESALVDKATRQSLGTHSTPAWLVDYA